jgi:hypothetical protein
MAPQVRTHPGTQPTDDKAYPPNTASEVFSEGGAAVGTVASCQLWKGTTRRFSKADREERRKADAGRTTVTHR